MASFKRLFTVTCLIGLVLTFTGLQAIKLRAVISIWTDISSLPLSVPPAYLAISAGIWMVIGGALTFGVWRAKAWALVATRWATIAFLVQVWLDRILLQVKGPQQNNWLFELGLSLVLTSSIIGILALPKVRAYFGEGNE